MAKKSPSASDRKTAAIVREMHEVADRCAYNMTELIAYFQHMARYRPKKLVRVLAWQAQKDPAFRAQLKAVLGEAVLLNLPRPDRLDS